jgi:hypothetical protein
VEVEADVAAIDPRGFGVPDGLRRQDKYGGGIQLGAGDGVRAKLQPIDQFDAGVLRWCPSSEGNP